MAQFLRPDSDVTSTNIASGNYTGIDETSASDSDYVETKKQSDGNTSRYECGLSNPSITPTSGTTTVRYRLGPGELNAVVITVTVSVYQGTTLIAASGGQTVPSSATTYSFTPDMSSVTNWNDLRLRFDFAFTGGGASSSGRLLWTELEAPDFASTAYTLTAASGTYTLTGSDAMLYTRTPLAAEAGSFVLTGSAVSFTKGLTMSAEAGSFTLTGGRLRGSWPFQSRTISDDWVTEVINI